MIYLLNPIYTHLEVLTDVLLEACAGFATAKLEQEKENKALLDEYWTRRDTIFDCLYQQAKEFMEADFQVSKFFACSAPDIVSV